MNPADALIAVRLELAALRELNARAVLGASDYSALAALLPLVHQATAGRAFALDELAERALRGDAKLATALAAATRSGGARRLGRMFARAAGVPVGGLLVRRVGDARTGARWAVVRVSAL